MKKCRQCCIITVACLTFSNKSLLNLVMFDTSGTGIVGYISFKYNPAEKELNICNVEFLALKSNIVVLESSFVELFSKIPFIDKIQIKFSSNDDLHKLLSSIF